MKVISFYNNKGGIGKTSLSTQIAVFYGEFLHESKKILFVDLDEQMNSTEFLLKENDRDTIMSNHQYNICNILNDRDFPVKDAIIPSAFLNVDLIPGSSLIGDVAETLKNDTGIVAQVILDDQLRKLDYDIVIIDCPPATGMITTMALVASDAIIVPVFPDDLSVNSLQICKSIIDKCRNNFQRFVGHPLKNLGCVLNNYSETESLSKVILESLQDDETDFPFSGIVIRRATRIAQSFTTKEAIIDSKRYANDEKQRDKVADNLLELAEYIYEKGIEE